MAISIKCKNPRILLAEIKKAIGENKIDTWQFDSEGDFTHSPQQWCFRAWMVPYINGQDLIFGILPPKDTTISTLIYAVYHGRFSEMLLSHFDDMIDEIILSSMPTKFDVISSEQ